MTRTGPDVIEDLRGHREDLDNLIVVLQHLHMVDRDTSRAETRVYELISEEYRDMGESIDRVEELINPECNDIDEDELEAEVEELEEDLEDELDDTE